MREIKFRAWDEEKGKMSYKLSCFGSQDSASWEDFIEENPILMQYTGLHDVSDQEIYEGDIVENINYSGYPKSVKNMSLREKVEKGWIFPVTWDICIDGEYGYQVSGFYFGSESKNFKVIGNIYENPEFIEPSKSGGKE
jgi:uncharacterized phage protein (TIGR01671 family)